MSTATIFLCWMLESVPSLTGDTLEDGVAERLTSDPWPGISTKELYWLMTPKYGSHSPMNGNTHQTAQYWSACIQYYLHTVLYRFLNARLFLLSFRIDLKHKKYHLQMKLYKCIQNYNYRVCRKTYHFHNLSQKLGVNHLWLTGHGWYLSRQWRQDTYVPLGHLDTVKSVCKSNHVHVHVQCTSSFTMETTYTVLHTTTFCTCTCTFLLFAIIFAYCTYCTST